MRSLFLFLLTAVCALPQTPKLAGCQVFPADNIWNTPVDTMPVHPSSAAYINTVGANTTVHPDFGTGTIGIPYALVNKSTPKAPVTFDYRDESDPGPYPIPPNPPIEAGSDHHILMLDQDSCVLYEMWNARQSNGAWEAGSGAIFDLNSNKLRPDTWTSADAAGLPILPGLVRYEEVAAGEIRHAIRFTVPATQKAYVWPATHYASSITDPKYPRMGERFRLRADFDISGFSPSVQVILRALKKYGMILADNGSAWYLTGAPNDNWDNDTLVGELRRVKGSDFEAVDSSSLRAAAGSAQIRHTVNAASYRGGAVAPGELISIFGSNFGPDPGANFQLDESGAVPNLLGGTRVLFDGHAAPMLYAGKNQVNAVAPYALAGSTSTVVEIEYNGTKVFSETLDVDTAAPGIIARDASGAGEGAILNEDYGVNSPQNPAGRGRWIMIYANGGPLLLTIDGLNSQGEITVAVR